MKFTLGFDLALLGPYLSIELVVRWNKKIPINSINPTIVLLTRGSQF